MSVVSENSYIRYSVAALEELVTQITSLADRDWVAGLSQRVQNCPEPGVIPPELAQDLLATLTSYSRATSPRLLTFLERRANSLDVCDPRNIRKGLFRALADDRANDGFVTPAQNSFLRFPIAKNPLAEWVTSPPPIQDYNGLKQRIMQPHRPHLRGFLELMREYVLRGGPDNIQSLYEAAVARGLLPEDPLWATSLENGTPRFFIPSTYPLNPGVEQITLKPHLHFLCTFITDPEGMKAAESKANEVYRRLREVLNDDSLPPECTPAWTILNPSGNFFGRLGMRCYRFRQVLPDQLFDFFNLFGLNQGSFTYRNLSREQLAYFSARHCSQLDPKILIFLENIWSEGSTTLAAIMDTLIRVEEMTRDEGTNILELFKPQYRERPLEKVPNFLSGWVGLSGIFSDGYALLGFEKKILRLPDGNEKLIPVAVLVAPRVNLPSDVDIGSLRFFR